MSNTRSQSNRPGPVPDGGWLMGRGRLAQSLMLEERGPERPIRIAALVIGLMVLGFIVWASFTQITEVVITSGEVSPEGSVQRVQHLEGGIVRQIMVREGDIVEEGQVLVELEASGTLPEREQLRARLAGLELQARALRAAATGEDADLALDDPRFAALVESQLVAFRTKQNANEAQAEVIRLQIAQRKSDLKLIQGQERSSRRQIGILNEQVSMRKDLESKGLISRVILLNDQRELARAEQNLAELVGQKRTAREAITEAESRLLELEARIRAEASEQLGQIEAEIAELRESLLQTEDRVARLAIRSPVKGFVQEFQTKTIGGVIAPGSTVLEVIPLEVELIVEARVTPKDIGFIFVGQESNVKINTYDYTRFGGIDGKIEWLSATTVEDESGDAFYRAKIRLDKNYVGEDPEANLVLPGMTVIADLKTGQKTLIEFLLKPVVRAFNEAFRER
ncbi:MAG: HlyD family type I secretion periplasmic adaptor subunit [Magnetovibrionaceae bacterium]